MLDENFASVLVRVLQLQIAGANGHVLVPSCQSTALISFDSRLCFGYDMGRVKSHIVIARIRALSKQASAFLFA